MKSSRYIVALLMLCTAVWSQAASRSVLSLDGKWQIAEGTMEKVPVEFNHQIVVPGLVDLAQPKFVDVGTNKSGLREAFWYRRTFTFKGEVPAVALLKIHKAAYGSRVYLNGVQLGEHLPSFTPGYFDAKTALRGGGAQNEIIIRVGAHRVQVPPALPDGWDVEKTRYIPGIFDSVELITSGTPNIVRVQIAPDITNQLIRVQAVLRNNGPETASRVQFKVREARSRRLVGEAVSPVSLGVGAEQTIDLKIPLRRCRLWSPEDPFLYELETMTEKDSLNSRFGMREFHLDQATGRAFLNGRPYFLRGSNVTLYRFFEDRLCGSLPWDEQWVRKLHRQFKTMHWNSLRYCIGFPPEMWYRIADEEGILIQDEFPIWYGPRRGWPAEIKSEQLTTEYTEWMQERWNHPCVVIWDAQNETVSTETGKAVRAVRGLDLSNRPWDNGYSEPGAPGDVFESHPYLCINPNFVLEDMAELSGVPRGNHRANTNDNPIIINEYAWLWLNRDGTPTTLSQRIYANLLGENATAEQRRHLYALYLAAKTEFWRSHRACAGVLHFCGLGYSRPDGQTCDNFIDIPRLKFEPEFLRYVGDAFAPVGIMLDEWSTELLAGQYHTFGVALINDLQEDWKGSVRLRVLLGSKVVQEHVKPCEITGLGRAQLKFATKLPGEPALYRFEAALVRKSDRPVCSVREIKLVSKLAEWGESLAKGKAVKASSCYTEHGNNYRAENAVDGKRSTRWSSDFMDNQWLAIDLGEPKTISRVNVFWETAYAEEYSIQVSDDGKTWKGVHYNKRGHGGLERLSFPKATTRWVRIYCPKRATKFGVSLWEMQVLE